MTRTAVTSLAVARIPLPRSGLAALLALILVGALLPWWVSDYRLFQFTMMLVYAIALVGLNLLTGYTGQISLGHGAFFAMGAYVAAVAMTKFGVPYWLTIPLAALMCFGVGFLFGLPALRLEGLYLALATFALAVAVPQLLRHKSLEQWTGGVQGIVLKKPNAPAGWGISADQWLYWFTFAVACAMFLLAWRLVCGPVGRAWVGVRDHPVAAAAMGVNVPLYKSGAFAASAMYAGVAGALSAVVVQFVAPDSFTMYLSISLLVGIVIGGLGTLSGALYGAVFIQLVPNISEQISKQAAWAVYGVFLLIFAFAMPAGFAGLAKRAFHAFARRK